MWALGTDRLGSDPSCGALGQLGQVSEGQVPDLELGLTGVPAFFMELLGGNLIELLPQSRLCVGTGCFSSR